MSEERKAGEELVFAVSETQTIAVPSDASANVFQADISIDTDATVTIEVGSTKIFSGALTAAAAPVQLFFYDFGKGRGTGVKGDPIKVTLGEPGRVYLTYIIHSDM